MSAVYTPEAIAHRNARFFKLLDVIEDIMVFWLILHFSSAFLPLVFTDHSNLDAENPLMRVLWYPSYLMIAAVILRRFPSFLRTVTFNPLMIICVLICGVSYIWSIEPSLTLRRSVAILMTTSFGLYLAARFNWQELVARIAIVYVVLAIGSLIFAVAIPEYGRMQEIHTGAWRGLWLEKNSFGAQMAKALLLMMCAFAMKPSRGWLWIPAGVLCFGLIIMCTSKTALLAALLMIGGFVFVRIMRAYPLLRIPVMYAVILGTVTLVLLLTFATEEMFALIGKDATLTGRTDIWDLLIQSIQKKPLLGYGYGTFWMDPLGPSYWIRFNLDWGVPTAHNGWIETWLSIGLLGVGMFGVIYVITLILALDRLARGGVENYWVLLSTILFLVLSMSESTILQQNHLDWVVFVATSAKLFCGAPAFWRDGRPSEPYWRPLPRHRVSA